MTYILTAWSDRCPIWILTPKEQNIWKSWGFTLVPWIMGMRNCGLIFIMMASSNGNGFCVTGLCAGNSPVTGEFTAQRPVTRSFDTSVDLRLNKRQLSKQLWGWWFETPSRPSWRHCNDFHIFLYSIIWVRYGCSGSAIAADTIPIRRLISKRFRASSVTYTDGIMERSNGIWG